jgi:pimeloyl-ACP methyl ester carboxylesterase
MLELAGEGIATFAFNNRHTNSAAGVDVVSHWEALLLDVSIAVAGMKELGYEKVVLYGASAGGALAASYQDLAESGIDSLRLRASSPAATDERVLDAVAASGCPLVDGLILQNASSGPSVSLLLRLDGSVVDERTGERDPRLDPFEERNGFDAATGAASYPPEFLRRYARAQAERMNGLVQSAEDALAQVTEGRGRTHDDEVMVILGTRASPFYADLSLGHRDTLGGTGPSVVSDRMLVPGVATRNRRIAEGSAIHTCRSFLSYRAVRVDAARHDPLAGGMKIPAGGMPYRTTNYTPDNLTRVSVPVLVTVGTADLEVHLPTVAAICDAVPRGRLTIRAFQGADHALRRAGGEARGAQLRDVVDWIFAHVA